MFPRWTRDELRARPSTDTSDPRLCLYPGQAAGCRGDRPQTKPWCSSLRLLQQSPPLSRAWRQQNLHCWQQPRLCNVSAESAARMTYCSFLRLQALAAD